MTMALETASGVAQRVRAYTPADRQAVREIACRTAFRNRGHQAFLDDAELFADYWTRYYTDFEPEACLVVERDGEIAGYLLGCVDSRGFQRAMARSILPPILWTLGRDLVRGRYRGDPQARRFFRWFVTRSWREAPPVDIARFPAHYHANLLPAAYGEGMYSTLALTFLDHAERRGVHGVHGQVLDLQRNGVWRRMVAAYHRQHPQVMFTTTERVTTIGSALLDEPRPMVNRAFGGSLVDFRSFLLWIQRWRRL
jgi:hypothetical protein